MFVHSALSICYKPSLFTLGFDCDLNQSWNLFQICSQCGRKSKRPSVHWLVFICSKKIQFQLTFDFALTDADGQDTNFTMYSEAGKQNFNAKPLFEYIENIIETNKETHWSEWSCCSVTCGNGTRTRTKYCPEKNETQTQYQACHEPPCDSKIVI